MVVAVVGIIMTLSIPAFLTYWKSSTTQAGANELATVLNGARQLAIKENTSVCVTVGSNGVTYRLGNCTTITNCANPATPPCVWRGPGTDNTGLIKLSNNVQVTATTASVVFTYLGAASTGGTYTVSNPSDPSNTRGVKVAPSGRISLQ